MSATPGFEPLDLGDVVTDSFERRGSVVEVDGKLIVLLAAGTWKYAEGYIAEAREHDNPYRVERRDWDLEPTFAVTYYNRDGNEVPVYEGTDLDAALA